MRPSGRTRFGPDLRESSLHRQFAFSEAPSARPVRARLRTLGAPLTVDALAEDTGPVEEVLVDGLRLSHSDPSVARAMPVCLHKHLARIDPERLETLARKAGEKRALGFFLELTGTLTGDRRLVAWSRRLRDRRVRILSDFFNVPQTPEWRSLSERNTPPEARHFGFRINLDRPSFASLLRKSTDSLSSRCPSRRQAGSRRH